MEHTRGGNPTYSTFNWLKGASRDSKAGYQNKWNSILFPFLFSSFIFELSNQHGVVQYRLGFQLSEDWTIAKPK